MKKVLGIFMIILGVLLAIGTLQSIFKFFSLSKSSSDEIAYSVGFLLGQVFMAIVIFLLIRYGLKFQKKPKSSLSVEKE